MGSRFLGLVLSFFLFQFSSFAQVNLELAEQSFLQIGVGDFDGEGEFFAVSYLVDKQGVLHNAEINAQGELVSYLTTPSFLGGNLVIEDLRTLPFQRGEFDIVVKFSEDKQKLIVVEDVVGLERESFDVLYYGEKAAIDELGKNIAALFVDPLTGLGTKKWQLAEFSGPIGEFEATGDDGVTYKDKIPQTLSISSINPDVNNLIFIENDTILLKDLVPFVSLDGISFTGSLVLDLAIFRARGLSSDDDTDYDPSEVSGVAVPAIFTVTEEGLEVYFYFVDEDLDVTKEFPLNKLLYK